MDTIGERIKELRNKNELTQEELGKKINVGKTTISNYENNYSKPNCEALIKLANTLDTTTDYLLGRSITQKGGNNNG